MKSTSIKEVIGSLIRDTGGSIDAGWYTDIIEWCFEGMKELETKHQLVTKSVDLTVIGHIATLPLDFVSLISVEDAGGNRLRLGLIQYNIENTKKENDNCLLPSIYDTSGIISPWSHDMTNLNYVSGLGYTANFYILDFDKIKLSFPQGVIRLNYNSYLSDTDGLPLLPDLQEYKQALKWYILMKLIGAGYKHPVFDYKYVRDEWTIYAARAIEKLRTTSVDKAEAMLHSINRLVFPYHGWSDYFLNIEQPQTIITHINHDI